VIVGVAQTLRRPDTAQGTTEPVAMMAEAARLAGDDSGTGDRLLRSADSIRVVELLSWPYPNPALLVGDLIGASPRQTVKTTTGGNSPQLLVNDTAAAIQRGELDVALVVGAEAVYTRLLARKEKAWLEWTTQDPDTTPAPASVGIEKPGTNDVEMAAALLMPTQVYPIFENALRAANGESVEEHERRVSELWAGFSTVAARNPYAWSPEARTAEEIRTVTPDNRMIGFPYPKLMNANIQTDQAAALILCSVQAARDAGVPQDRWVFVHSGADAHDHYWVSERENLHSSPAIAACGRAAFGLAGIGADDLAHVDLYSCFPSAVQIGAAAIGLGLDRQLTVTGGLGFAGGPGNNYVTHSIASMTEALRNDPGANGLVTALGWYITKHAAGVYSTRPPADGFRTAHPQAEVDALPRRAFTGDYDGPVSIESFTVMHERDNTPANAIVACLTPDGRRCWATTNEPGHMKALMDDAPIGAAAQVSGGGIELG
jgi:acetyl-CoA C-acetyltransferase